MNLMPPRRPYRNKVNLRAHSRRTRAIQTAPGLVSGIVIPPIAET
jgi:hypothetical protein